MSTTEIHSNTFHFAGVLGNVERVFCFEQPEGQPGSFESLLRETAGNEGKRLPVTISLLSLYRFQSIVC